MRISMEFTIGITILITKNFNMADSMRRMEGIVSPHWSKR